MTFLKLINSMSAAQRFYILVVALFSVNFLAYGNLISIAGCVLLLVFCRTLEMPRSSLFLWFYLFAVAYPTCTVLFGGITGMTTSLFLVGIGVASSYLLGNMALRLFPRCTPSVFVLLICFGFAAHGMLNFVANILSGTGGNGQCIDFWTRSYSAATAQAILFTPLIAIMWAVLLAKRKRLLKIVTLAVMVAALYYDFMLGGRSFFVLMALSGLVLLAIKLCNVNKSIFDATKSAALIFILCVVVFALYQADFLSLKSSFETSYMAHRFSYQGVGDDDRSQRWLYYIAHFSEGILGGNVIGTTSGYGYAHNLWLDTFDEAGLLPLVLLVLITVQSIAKTIQVASRSDVFEQSIILSFLIILMTQFFVEPIMQGSPLLFMAFAYFCGLFDRESNRLTKANTRLENNDD
ncbi:hypothetical protein [uncultured Ellagibacter sp.]|uniref:hypothetical protein n=1 Tax=uncultured Ellagibacter sp. TaxID=2137580 RepID=UPI0025E51CB7|nr:hypothetical protein [uncultured Ellagibacter sp.]